MRYHSTCLRTTIKKTHHPIKSQNWNKKNFHILTSTTNEYKEMEKKWTTRVNNLHFNVSNDNFYIFFWYFSSFRRSVVNFFFYLFLFLCCFLDENLHMNCCHLRWRFDSFPIKAVQERTGCDWNWVPLIHIVIDFWTKSSLTVKCCHPNVFIDIFYYLFSLRLFRSADENSAKQGEMPKRFL